MKNGLRVFFYLLAVATCLAAPNKAEAQVAEPLYHWRAVPGDTLMNSNPAAYAGGIILLQDSIPYAPDYTVIVVYKPVQDTEAMLWNIAYGDGSVRGLTTEHIQSDSIAIRYTPNTALEPAISTLRQTAPDSVSPKAVLNVGGTASVAELLYYGRRLGVAELRKVQSVLAVRYGITLGPVDWRIGGVEVWPYDSTYRHRVTGVGTDTASGLCQPASLSEMSGVVLSVGTDTLADGTFLLVGDDGGPLEFESCGDAEFLTRRWKAAATHVSDEPFTLTFDTRQFAQAADTLVLMVDSAVYLPSRTGGGKTTFNGVTFGVNATQAADSATVHHISLGRGGALLASARLQPRRSCAGNGAAFQADIYPNPTSGRYTLEVSGARHVAVTIYNTQGVAVGTHSHTGGGPCRFDGELPSGNVYYATIVTESGSQTLKLAVK